MTTLTQPERPTPVAPRFPGLGILDAVRGGTALYVVAGHAAILLFASRQASASISAAAHAFATFLGVFAFGHEAVVMFFVLSGFCIHWKQAGGLAGEPDRRAFDTMDYVRRRLRRIAPPYYFALAVTSICSVAISAMLHGGMQATTGNDVADLLLTRHTEPSTLVGNLFFLQWIAVPTYGTNTPLWSLSYEFFLYFLYLAFLPLRKGLGLGKAVAVVAAASIAGYFLSRHSFYILNGFCHILAYWLVWVLGAVAAEVFRAYPNRRIGVPARVGLTVALVVWLLSSRIGVIPTDLSDTIGALICAALLLWWVRRAQDVPVDHGVTGALGRVGAFSYSLYLTHVPLFSVLATAWLVRFHHQPGSPWLLFASIPTALIVGWLSYVMVERRFIGRA